jgi:hypothetical protein
MLNRRIILFIVFLITLTLAAYVLIVVIPARFAEQTYSGARRIAGDIRDTFRFTPEVRVNNTVIVEQEKKIAELALVSQRFRHEYTWTNTWMGSTKKILITGSFEAKAGFDLNKSFVVDVLDDKIIITFPPAQLLSLTPQHDLVFRDENGIWNWVNNEDRTNAVNAFTRNARQVADTDRYSRAAEEELKARLSDILRPHGKEVVFLKAEAIELN